jgi:hypothetical protein
MARETRAIWAKRVKRWKRSGLKATEFAEREGLKAKTLWWWNWRLHRGFADRETPTFVEVAPAPAAVTADVPASASALGVIVGNVRVVVPIGFDEDTLRRLLRVVESR